MIVIDTHALVWLFYEGQRLGSGARTAIEAARGGEGVLVPAIMGWEISMLIDKDRLALGSPPDLFFKYVMEAGGFRWVGLDPRIAIDAGMLPGNIHGDPADRMIVATARHHGCPLLTGDRKILAYAAAGHLNAIDARA